MSQKLQAAMNPYPAPDAERTAIVRQLGMLALDLDHEADNHKPRLGTWNDIVHTEIRRASGTVRLVATLVLNGSYPVSIGRFWVRATKDYVSLIRRMNWKGVIE